LLIDRSLKLATPATAATVSVPESVPLLGLFRIAMVTLTVESVSRFPSASTISTCTDDIVPPAAVLVG